VKDNISVLTQLAAASVYNLLSIYNINSKIKWPNDILVNNKKISGILVETIIENDIVHVAIGIGLNVNNCMFDGEIASTATSVILESGNLQQVEEVFEKLVKELNDIYQAYIKEDLSFMAICRMHSCLIGKAIKLENEIVLVKDIDDLGRLIIDKNGIDTAYFGSEISLHDIYESVGE
jgi:BirA family biotin operon repressor/biotin-[acetyl-CoA-carboxylase] ligase